MKRALVVDDHDENLYLLNALLTANGWEVDQAHNGTEALHKAHAVKPTVVISDLLMPVMDGFTLLRHWRNDEALRSIPFVVYTATYTASEDEHLARDLGADEFILKPAEPEAFLERIRVVVSNGIMKSPAHMPRESEAYVMKEYSEALVRKLEDKSAELAQANEGLGAREQRLILALQSARMGMWDWNLVTGKIVWSEGHERLWGIDPHSFNGKYDGFEERVHPEDRERVKVAIESALATQQEYNCEYRVVWPDQSVHWVAGRGHGVYDEAGKAIRMIGIIMDISERREAELAREESQRKVAASERLLRGILDSMFTFVGLFSKDGIVLDTNRAPLQAANMGKEEFVGKPVRDTFLLNHSPQTQAQIDNIIARAARGETVREDFDLRVADGSIIVVDSTFGPLYGENGEVEMVVGSGVDVTARRQAQAMRQQLEAQLWQAQKMEALGTLAGGVAHDFNNIISIISGNAELAQQDVGVNHPATTSLREITKASRRAKAIVQQILTFTRKQSMQRRLLSLQPLLEEFATMLRATIPASVDLVITCEPNVPDVFADATQIHQVLLNLGTNAWHALPNDHGRIEFRLSRAHLDSMLTTPFSNVQPGDYALISVIDNGSGMEAKVCARMFEPFFTTKEVGKGTGLGLAVVDGIVRSHEGAVTVESTPGHGTTFKVYLPAGTSASINSELATEQTIHRGHGQRIIYIDDDTALVTLATKILSRYDYNVRGFSDIAAALDAVREQPRSVDLVITDYSMPSASGVQVAKLMRAIRPDIPVVLVTGFVTPDLQQRAREAGIRAVMLKPDNFEEFCEAIERILENKP